MRTEIACVAASEKGSRVVRFPSAVTTVFLAMSAAVSVQAGTVGIYPFPVSMVADANYRVWVDGKEISVWQTRGRSVANFGFTGKVSVEVQYSANFTAARILPTNYVMPVVKTAANKAQFMMSDSGDYHNTRIIFRIDNDKNKELFLFGDPPEGTPPTGATVYEPGEHRPAGGLISLRSNQTIYLKAGAVVHASIRSANANNIKVLGRGIIVAQRVGNSGIDITMASGIEIDGITYTDEPSITSGNWCLYAKEYISNLTIKNVKIISEHINADGLKLGGQTKNVRVTNYFNACGDNGVTMGDTGYNDDIVLRNLVMYQIGGGSTAQIYIEAGNLPNCTYSKIQNVLFKEIYSIDNVNAYGVRAFIGFQWGNGSQGADSLRFEDVFIEPDAEHVTPLIYTTNDQGFDPAQDLNIYLTNVHYGCCTVGGNLWKDKFRVTYSNVYYKGALVTTRAQANITGPGTVIISNTPVETANSACGAGMPDLWDRMVPSRGEIAVTIPSPGRFSLRIFDAAGKVLAERQGWSAGNSVVSIGAPVSGAIFMQVDNGGITGTRRLVHFQH